MTMPGRWCARVAAIGFTLAATGTQAMQTTATAPTPPAVVAGPVTGTGAGTSTADGPDGAAARALPGPATAGPSSGPLQSTMPSRPDPIAPAVVAGGPQPVPPSVSPTANPDPVPVTPTAVAAGAGENSADYILGSADKVRITVYGEPGLTGEYFVTSSGTVNLPLAGDVQASGLTLRDFRERLIKALQDGYLKDPKISVEVLTFRPFYILGEVVRPGQYPYTTGLTVFNAVATAGGFTYRANTRKIFIKKPTDSQEHEYPLNSQTPISPGDTVRVPERFF